MTDHCAVEVGDVDEFAPGSVTKVTVGDRVLAIARIDDDFYALGDTCSHEDVSLSEGEIDTDECALECDKHGSLFSLETGEALTLPATRPVPTYEVEHRDGSIWVVVS